MKSGVKATMESTFCSSRTFDDPTSTHSQKAKGNLSRCLCYTKCILHFDSVISRHSLVQTQRYFLLVFPAAILRSLLLLSTLELTDLKPCLPSDYSRVYGRWITARSAPDRTSERLRDSWSLTHTLIVQSFWIRIYVCVSLQKIWL